MTQTENGRPTSGPSTGGPSTSGLLRAVTAAAASLLRLEVRQAQEEMGDKARNAAKGAALLGGAGLLGAAALGASVTWLVRLLDRLLPRPASAAVVTAGLGAAAAVLGTRGVAELRRVGGLLPEQTIRSVQDDIGAAPSAPSQTAGVAGAPSSAPVDQPAAHGEP